MITSVTLDSEQTERIYLEVEVSDNVNNRTESFEVRVGIVGTEVVLGDILTVTVSNFNYSMSVAFGSPGEDPGVMVMALPPGGESTISFLVSNTGDGGRDDVVISVSGMESSVLRTVRADGIVVEDEVSIPANGQIFVEIEFEVMEVESGTSGVIRVGVTSKKNTAQTPSFVDISVDIRTVHDLQFTLESADSKKAPYPENVEFTLYVTNQGNTEEEVEVLSSDSLRGWSVDVISDEFKIKPGETRQVKVRVTPPNEMISEDEYTFTVIVQPKGLPVAGQPVDLTVKSTMGAGSVSDEMQQALAIGVITVGSILVIALFIRSRTENQMLVESLISEQDD